MAFGLAKIKQDFAKHKAKAAVLSSLSVVMVVLVVKGIFDMMPQPASAESASGAALTATPANALAPTPTETEDRIRRGQQLWRLLRERRGIAPAVAFTFDASYFAPDPNRRIMPGEDANPRIDQPPERASTRPATNEETEHARKASAIGAEAKSLIVRSTVVGGANPVAVINGQILAAGDHILGFEILAIRAREVVFRKDDVTLAVQMAGNTLPK